jgi:HlyD family secretion protein
MSTRLRRYLLWTVLIAALGGGVAFAFWPRPISVEVVAVARGPMQVTIDEYGQTRIRDVYLVSAPGPGELSRIELEPGDPVAAGETIIGFIQPAEPTLLDARSYQERVAAAEAAAAAVTLAESDVRRTEAELEFAVAELDRARTLNNGNTISDRQLQVAETEFKIRDAAHGAALASLAIRRFELDRARAGLAAPEDNFETLSCCLQVVAPVGGRVLRVLRSSSGLVAGGEPLIEIGNPDGLEVMVDVLTTDAVKVEEDADVIIVGWGKEDRLLGRVRRVEPYGFTKVSALGIEEQRVNVLVDFESPTVAWERLGHGFRVETQIVTWRTEDALKVPLGAIFREGNEWAVFLANGNRAELRIIEVGHRNAREAEVLSGLEADDLVILHPTSSTVDGLAIQPWPVGP